MPNTVFRVYLTDCNLKSNLSSAVQCMAGYFKPVNVGLAGCTDCALFELTALTCSLSGLVKVFHQSREQNTKAESHTNINSIANRC